MFDFRFVLPPIYLDSTHLHVFVCVSVASVSVYMSVLPVVLSAYHRALIAQ